MLDKIFAAWWELNIRIILQGIDRYLRPGLENEKQSSKRWDDNYHGHGHLTKVMLPNSLFFLHAFVFPKLSSLKQYLLSHTTSEGLESGGA